MKKWLSSHSTITIFLLTGLLLVTTMSIALADQETAGLDPGSVYLPVIFDGTGFGPGTVSGYVIDAVEGTLLDGIEVCFFEDDECEFTDSNGEYSFPNIPSGYRYFYLEADNYAELTQGVYVLPGEINILNFALSPDDLEDVGQYRIVLSWDEDPKDLDAHLWTPDLIPWDRNNDGIFYPTDPTDPAPRNHIYQEHRADCDSVLVGTTACLDKDNRNGFGPETITIKEAQTGTYYYAVQRYEPGCPEEQDGWCLTPLEGSGARVQIYDYTGVRTDASFSVPTIGNEDEHLFWYVFNLDFDVIDGELGINSPNCFTYRPDPRDDPPECPIPPVN